MSSLSDTLTVGLVLVLLFGSIALYLYTRIQQVEQKTSLLESILLDMKMSLEVKSYTQLPAGTLEEDEHLHEMSPTEITETYMPYTEDNTTLQEDTVSTVVQSSVLAVDNSESSEANDVEQYKSVIADAVKDEMEVVSDTRALPLVSPVTVSSVQNVNYEAMSLKELQSLAKSRGITGAGSMKKGPIIEALKTSDRIQPSSIEPGSGSSTGTFLETSSPFLGNETQ